MSKHLPALILATLLVAPLSARAGSPKAGAASRCAPALAEYERFRASLQPWRHFIPAVPGLLALGEPLPGPRGKPPVRIIEVSASEVRVDGRRLATGPTLGEELQRHLEAQREEGPAAIAPGPEARWGTLVAVADAVRRTQGEDVSFLFRSRRAPARPASALEPRIRKALTRSEDLGVELGLLMREVMEGCEAGTRLVDALSHIPSPGDKRVVAEEGFRELLEACECKLEVKTLEAMVWLMWRVHEEKAQVLEVRLGGDKRIERPADERWSKSSRFLIDTLERDEEAGLSLEVPGEGDAAQSGMRGVFGSGGLGSGLQKALGDVQPDEGGAP